MYKKCIRFLLIKVLTVLNALMMGSFAVAEHSPVNGGSPYISFGDNSMPGCYGDSGGYLASENENNRDRTFSILLAAHLSKTPVSVYYTFANTDPSYSGWGKCTIDAVELR